MEFQEINADPLATWLCALDPVVVNASVPYQFPHTTSQVYKAIIPNFHPDGKKHCARIARVATETSEVISTTNICVKCSSELAERNTKIKASFTLLGQINSWGLVVLQDTLQAC